jgi:8-oxo-dGTP diphosphatase
MEYDESPRQCVEREVTEETGLLTHAGEVLGVYSGFDDPRQHAVLFVYWMDESDYREPVAGDDADEALFFQFQDIPKDIAFRAHREALRDAFAHPRLA